MNSKGRADRVFKVNPCQWVGCAIAGLVAVTTLTEFVTAQADETFDNAANTGIFDDAGNWVGGVFPGPNFGGDSVGFNLPGLVGLDIDVQSVITGLGGLEFEGPDSPELTFVGVGNFTFDTAALAIINPGTGSFIFDIGFTSESEMALDLSGGNGIISFKQNAVFKEVVDITSDAGGLIQADGATVLFEKQVTARTGGIFVASDGGSMQFDGDFVATGNQNFRAFSAESFIFNGAASFDGGVVGVSGDPGSIGLTFDAIFNGAVAATTGTNLAVADGGRFIFNDDFQFDGDISFTGNGSSGKFIFNDFATGLVLDALNTITVNETEVEFLRSVTVEGGDALRVENNGQVVFAQDVNSADSSNFIVETDGQISFEGNFFGTGDQNFGTSGGGAAAGTLFFSQAAEFDNGGADGTATFTNTTANFNSLTIGDAYDLLIDGSDGKSQITVGGDADFGGTHVLDMTGESAFTVGGDATFAADQTLSILHDSPVGAVVGDMGVVNFNGDMSFAGDMDMLFESGSQVDDALVVTLGAADSTISTGGDLAFGLGAGGNSGTNTIDLLGSIDVLDGVTDFTFTVDLGATDTVNIKNTALANVSEGLLDVNSGIVSFYGGPTTNSEGTLDLTIGENGVVQLQPGGSGLALQEINFGELNSTGSGAVVTGLKNDDADFAVLLGIKGGNFAGTITDGDTATTGNVLSLNNKGGTFVYTGNADYTGATQASEGSIFELGDDAGARGEIIGTGALGVGINALVTGGGDQFLIRNGQITTTIGDLGFQDGRVGVGNNSLLRIENPDNGDVSGLTAAGDLEILGSTSNFEMETGTRVIIEGDTKLQGTLTVSGDEVTPVGEFDLQLGNELDDTVLMTGLLSLADSSRSSISGLVDIGASAGSSGEILVTDDAFLDVGGQLLLAGANSQVTLSDDAQVNLGTDVDADSSLLIDDGQFLVEGRAEVTALQDVTTTAGSLAIAGNDETNKALFTAESAMNFEFVGTLDMSGESHLDAQQGITFFSEGSVVDGSGSLITGGQITVADGGGLEFRSADADLASLAVINLAGENVVVESGGNLFGNANFVDIGNLEVAGTVLVGANADTVGRMNIANGNYVSGSTGDLHLGFTWDSAAILGE
ncbi:MAG: hypothetical protein MK085_00875, partial [Phycisphaerales bacterium]|nr:hypothetical protein [Phycisphaerales bacterium]